MRTRYLNGFAMPNYRPKATDKSPQRLRVVADNGSQIFEKVNGEYVPVTDKK